MPRTKKRVRAPRGPLPRGHEPVLARFERMCKRHTQVGVAKLSGVSIQTVCDVANGRRAPWGKLLSWLGYELRYARLPREHKLTDVTTPADPGDTARAGASTAPTGPAPSD